MGFYGLVYKTAKNMQSRTYYTQFVQLEYFK